MNKFWKFKMLFVLIFFFGILGLGKSSQATTWYIDKDATGNNDGKSWANAFTQLCTYNSSTCTHGIPFAGYGQCPNANAVCGGDTIYVSGGVTSKTYTMTRESEFLNGADLNGADNNHRLTIRTGAKDTSAGYENHGGLVIFDGNDSYQNLASLPVYTTLDGEKDGKINWKFRNTFKPDKWSHAIVANGDYTIIKYIEVYNVAGGIIMWNQRPGGEVSNCYLHDVRGDYGIAIDNEINAQAYDLVKIHHNIISINTSMDCGGSGPDGIQGVGGSSIYNNIIKHELGVLVMGVWFSNGSHQPAIGDTVTIPSTGATGKITYLSPLASGSWGAGAAHGSLVMETASSPNLWVNGGAAYIGGTQFGMIDANSWWTQHSDYIQGWAHYNKVFNNTFINAADSMYDMGGDSFDNTYVFNNLFYQDSDTPLCDPPGPTGIRYSGYIGPSVMNRLYFLNNTFVDMHGAGTLNLKSGNTGTIINTEIKNNIFINSATTGYSRIINMGMVGVNSNTISIDRNLTNSGPNGNNFINFNDSPYTQSTGWLDNPTANYTPFVSYAVKSKSNNYHLRADDTVARGQGSNLTSHCSIVPELCFDKEGNPRATSGAWDLGAYEYVSGGDTTAPAAPTGLNVQ
jgi:hypothetical protein